MSGPSILVLGPVEAHGPAGPIAVSGAKLQALLALLALAVPHPVSDDRLIDALWGDDQPTNPANSLQAQVSQLRRVLGREVVVRRGPGYLLAVEPEQVDAHRLDALTALAQDAGGSGDHRGAAQHLRAALSLIRGPVLADLQDHDFAREAAGRLDDAVLDLREALVDAELAAGRHAEVVGTIAALAREHPLRERFAAQLVTALYRCGRQVDALRAYATVRDALIEEFGVEPSQELQDLEVAVLAHDPAIAAPARPSSPTTVGPEAAPDASDPFHHTIGRLPMVGRDAEVAVLRGDLADVLVGRGRVSVLVGEPGIGKTRLAEEAASEAKRAGAVIGWGRSHPGGAAPAFWPWVQVIRTLLSRLPSERSVDALGRSAAVIGQLVAEVEDLVTDLQPPPPLDPEGARFRVHDAVTTFLRRLAAGGPVVIALDDIQWADQGSLDLLTHLAREITDASVWVLVTNRSVGAVAGGDLTDALAQLVRQPIARRIDLVGLDREALGDLVAVTGGSADDSVLTTVHRRTQGNPFFAVEVLRLLPAAGELADLDDIRHAVPTGVRDVIRQRLAMLPDDCTDLLRVASVAGRELDARTLAAATASTPGDVLELLQPALDQGIVVERSSDRVQEFSHGLVAETLYGDLGGAARARHHHELAVALGSRHGHEPGPHLLEVANHWARAIPVAPIEDAVASALVAARWAEDHLDHGHALAHLQVALELVAQLPAGRPRDLLELEVQDQLGVLHFVTTGYSSEHVQVACTRMRELCLAIGGHPLLVPALWRLAIYHCIAMQLDVAVDLGEQLLALAGADESDPGALLAGHLALGTIHTHRGDIATGRRHLDRATELMDAGHGVALASGVVAETPEVWLHAFSAWNWWLHGDEAMAEELTAAAVAAGRAAGAPYGTMFALWFSVLVATLQRDSRRVLSRCEEAVEVATATGFGGFLAYMIVCRGRAVSAGGEPEIGGDELQAAAAAVTASGARMMVAVFPAFHADALLINGRHADALSAVERGLALVEDTGERWYEAELLRLQAEALAGLDPTDGGAAEAARRAVDVAIAQGAEGLRYRAEATLTRLGG